MGNSISSKKPFIPTPDTVVGYPNHYKCLEYVCTHTKGISEYLSSLSQDDCINVFVKKGYDEDVVSKYIHDKIAISHEPSAPPFEEFNDLNQESHDDINISHDHLNIKPDSFHGDSNK